MKTIDKEITASYIKERQNNQTETKEMTYYYEVILAGEKFSDFIKAPTDDIDALKASYKLKGKGFKRFREITKSEYLAGVEEMFNCWN